MRYRCQYPSRFTVSGALMEWSTPITAKRRDVIYRVFRQNGLIETGKPTLAERSYNPK
jgi:hypothetical protein